jgi:DNA repair protein SbcD/Mre11
MFRFIHAADLHLDSPLRGLSSKDGAPMERLRGATRRALENLVDLALRESIDFVVIAGDLYDGEWRDHQTGLFFVRQAVRLQQAGIPIYLIAGNHDAASVITKKLALPDNVITFSSAKASTHQHPVLPVAIHAQSFATRSTTDNLALGYPAAVKDRFNIGILHTSLTGYEGHDPYAPCSLSDLQSRRYQYWALGHIHMPAVLCEDPPIVFSGNTQGRHARELGPRGCRLVTVGDALTVEKHEFIPLDTVRWELVSVNLSPAKDETDALSLIRDGLCQTVAENTGCLLVVRLHLTGATSLHSDLQMRLPHWVAQIESLVLTIGEHELWVEKVAIATESTLDLTTLAARDDLAAQVIQSLDQVENTIASRPGAIAKLLAYLPPVIAESITEDLVSSDLPDDVRALVVGALTRKSDLEV